MIARSATRVGPFLLGLLLRRIAQVAAHDLVGLSVLDERTVEPDYAAAKTYDRCRVVAYEQNRPPGARYFAHFSQRFPLESRVSDSEHLVHEQDVRLDVSRDRESQARLHAGRVTLDGRVDEALDLGERDDLIELSVDLFLLHAKDRAV